MFSFWNADCGIFGNARFDAATNLKQYVDLSPNYFISSLEIIGHNNGTTNGATHRECLFWMEKFNYKIRKRRWHPLPPQYWKIAQFLSPTSARHNEPASTANQILIECKTFSSLRQTLNIMVSHNNGTYPSFKNYLSI